MRLQLPLGDTLKEPGFFILVFFAPGYAYFSLLSTTELIFLLFYFNPFSECCDTKLFWKSRLSWEVSNNPQEKNLLLGSNPGHPFQFSITHWPFQSLDKSKCFAMTFLQNANLSFASCREVAKCPTFRRFRKLGSDREFFSRRHKETKNKREPWKKF